MCTYFVFLRLKIYFQFHQVAQDIEGVERGVTYHHIKVAKCTEMQLCLFVDEQEILAGESKYVNMSIW